MSGLVAPDGADVVVGLLLDVAWKVTVPLALGLAASALPGSSAARHLRLTLALAATPALVVATIAQRGADAAVDAPVWPAAVWAIGAAVSLGGLARGLWALRALRTTRTPEGWERCDALSSPMTAGWWRPRLLVPAGFEAWPAEARAAALAHERAHVRRADWLVHVFAWALHAVLWFHPLLPWARRRLALLAECAADDAVLAEGHDATAYAELLLRLGRPGPAAALPLGRSFVGVRVRRLLTAGRAARSPVPSALLVAALLLVATPLTAGAAAWRAPEPVLGCGPAAPPVLLPVHPTPVYWSHQWSSSSPWAAPSRP